MFTLTVDSFIIKMFKNCKQFVIILLHRLTLNAVKQQNNSNYWGAP